ncbi:RHS repeat-associated core domain-containing protein [Bacteroides uniformis]|uniref:RHS repeat-associated core domain-containing protein n=2 Tax=Bacteroides uniformis TaxID=820 RepID=UPI0021668AAE|nr:RHS repeat-associated core domain-containing protein [Bacteroides uniformis]MCS2412881.1 RHS repeat-associated core domain-containing protein [Bacteroides uniformis]
MKRKYMFMALLCYALTTAAQDASHNYVRTRSMLDETGGKYLDKVEYYDGLGRPFQTVLKKVTASSSNLVTLQEYDVAGRAANSWLPIVSSAEYVAPAAFKSSAPGNYGNDSRPYGQPVYEASPLNRTVKEYGPGAAWHGGHSVNTDYLANSTANAQLNCINYGVSSAGALTSNGSYASGQLSVVKTTDEDLNVSYTFTDKMGHVVLSRQMKGSETHDTYYVYDDKGNLCFVLQPMYQSSANLDQYAFQYKYDGRNRCIWKKLPGAGYVEMVYDNADRLVFSQDGNQRALSTGNWMYYKYDGLNRLTEQGTCTNKVTTSGTNVLVQHFYDSYAFRSQAGFNNSNFPDDASGNGKGALTASVATVLGSSNKIYTAYYYDIKGRVAKTVQSNLLGGYDVTATVYTFTDKPATVTHTHTASGKPTRTEMYTYSYDHADRLLKVEHTLGGTKITLADYAYDNLGRLQSKSLHGSATNKLTYAYNVRSWLTGISGSKFTQNLYYNTGNGTACYTGNISSMTWKAGNESTIRGYKFTYDGLSRLMNATYGETAGINTNTNRFSENVTAYDKNGNIKTLQRYGQTAASSYGLIDNLTFTLGGNLLSRVDDAAAASAYNGGFEFKDGVKQANEYTYDSNGNLTKDLNKGISNISYNCLNLPSAVTFSDGSTIVYTYAADGAKLKTVHKIGGTTTTTDYCGNVIYENGVQKLLLTEEGYVTLSDGKYHYYLKDHQGNNRVVINQSGTVEEANHYYPFGGVFASSGNVQPYKYNGKEYDGKKGLNWYDYGARHYDAALGRFTTNDRFSEKYHSLSPYQYGANNPVNTIDINGDSLLIVTPAAIEAIYNGLQDGSNIKMQFNNGILDPTSIAKQANSSNDFFLKDLFEIANSEKMVELSLSDKNTYKMNGKTVEETFGTPYDDDDSEIPAHQKEEYSKAGVPFGKHIQGNLGQTLVPDKRLASGKSSTNSHVQVIINKNGTLNHRTVGIAHEFGHVILYLRNVPFSHGQPGVNNFIYNKRADVMSKRLGYDY